MQYINPFLLRSWLFFPAIEERFLNKIASLEGLDKPDGVVFDLEDSIAPSAKKMARERLRSYLVDNQSYRDDTFSKYAVAIRINGFGTPHFDEDLKLMAEVKPHFIDIPKVESAEQIEFFRKKFPDTQLIAIIESIAGYEHRDEIFAALKQDDLVQMGYEDLSKDLLIERPARLDEANPVNLVINACVITAKKYNIALFDGVYRGYGTQENLEGLTRESEFIERIGFTGKDLIHPSHVAVVNRIFDKSKLLERSKEVLGHFDKLEGNTFVISSEDKEMMDTPSYVMYQKIRENLTRQQGQRS